jgi:hypothetical protein
MGTDLLYIFEKEVIYVKAIFLIVKRQDICT